MNASSTVRQKRVDLCVIEPPVVLNHLNEELAAGGRRHHAQVIKTALQSPIVGGPEAEGAVIASQRSGTPNASFCFGGDIFHD